MRGSRESFLEVTFNWTEKICSHCVGKKGIVQAESTVRFKILVKRCTFNGNSNLRHIIIEPMKVSDIAKRKQKQKIKRPDKASLGYVWMDGWI